MYKFFLLFFILTYLEINAQSYIEAVPVFKKQTSEDFTNEWQYVSTDLYLLNGSKFTNLIRQVNPARKRFSFKKKEHINNILVTAQLIGLKGYDQVVYPIFNFQVKKDDNGNDVINVAETEVLRIIDNFPLSSIHDNIEAKIQVKAFTNRNKSQMYKFVGKQLEIISKISNPTEAILDIIGEFGKLMEKNTAGEQYQFESTIRVYEEKNFNKRFHSIVIFLFKPSQGLNISIDSTAIINYIAKNQNPKFDKEILRRLINFYTYPIIVAVNYRSKYMPKIPDEVTFESLKQRSVKNETDYKQGLISSDIYIQEKNLIDFLTAFAQLKLDVNNYQLDYKAKITDDYSIELFIILQDYWRLRNTYKTIAKANKNNPLFINEFKPIYDMFLSKAQLYLEANASLRNIKEMVNILYDLENNPNQNLDSAQREEYLQKLYAIELPKRELYSDEAKTIKKWISTLENDQYYLIFKPKIDTLSSLPADENTYKYVKELQQEIEHTSCILCRDKANAFISNFYIQYNQYLQNKEQQRLYELKSKAKLFVLKKLKTYQCIKNNLDSAYSGEMPEYIKYIKQENESIKNQLNKLISIVNNQQIPQSYNELKTLNNTIENIMNKISVDINNICQNYNEICNCQVDNSSQ